MEWKKDLFVVSDDVNKLDIDVIYQFLTNSYWGKGRSRDLIFNSVQNSFSLGLYFKNMQIGFARAITDYSTFAYLCDVFVLEEYRKKELGHFLMDCLFKHEKLNSVKWLLKTTNAQSLYQDFNFKELDSTSGWMIRKQTLTSNGGEHGIPIISNIN